MTATATSSHVKAALRGASATDSWGIAEFSAMFGVTPRTIRFYEDKGLLSPQRDGQVRVFRAQDRVRFDRIMRGKRLGFSLQDIKAVLDVIDGVVTDRREILRRKANFEAVLDSLEARRADLDALARDMSEVIDIADDVLAQTPDALNVTDLAARYQAAFAKTLNDNPLDFMSGAQPSNDE